jgi:benzoyl-CoA reductase/2-hydroxyglutaryl-CoA dehydratase subunit BcrC/BadD/HgdB
MFDDYARRQRNILETVQRGAAEGVILMHNQFCDLHGVENTRLRIDLEREGIPTLVLEKEYGAASDLGRIKTRVQAFLERIGK